MEIQRAHDDVCVKVAFKAASLENLDKTSTLKETYQSSKVKLKMGSVEAET